MSEDTDSSLEFKKDNTKGKLLKDIMEETLLSSRGVDIRNGFYKRDRDYYTEENRKNQNKSPRRTRYEVLNDVLLVVIANPSTPRDIKTILKLTAAVTQTYVNFALKTGLIADCFGFYEITPKGVIVQQKLSELLDLVDMKYFNE